MKPVNPLYGLVAEFDSAESLRDAAASASSAGYQKIDALSPFAISGMDQALRLPKSRVPMIVLIGGIVGGLSAFGMQVFADVFNYPENVGGRPLYSWPAFIPITFELTVLGAGLAGAFGMLILNRLPQPYHPLFNVAAFEQASQTKFFLCIESADAKFDVRETRAFLQSLGAAAVHEVPQ